MTSNHPKFNRDYQYLARLSERVKLAPENLLNDKIRKRLRSIQQYWRVGHPPRSLALAERADKLLQADTSGLTPRTGSEVMVTLHTRTGNVKVRCRVIRQLLFNRYEVAPIQGEGRISVNASSVQFF